MHISLKFILFLTLAHSCSIGVNGESSELEAPPAKSRFKKFLNLFGIGSVKQFQQGEHLPEYNPYGYPCVVQTTTTTPAPVILSPLLCPYPPMMPSQHQPGGLPPIHYQPSGNELTDLPPPPPGSPFLPPPNSNGPFPLPAPPSGPNSRPQPNFPGQFPSSPFPGQPPFPGQKPLPGQRPQFPFPGPPNFPGQDIPNFIPPQHFPRPGQHGPHPFPGSLIPTNAQQSPDGSSNPIHGSQPRPMLTEFRKPEKVQPDTSNLVDPIKVGPTVVDPNKPVQVNPQVFDPTNPIQVNPQVFDPTRPVQVNPQVFDPTRPVQVNPQIFDPTNPIQVNPTNFRPSQPMLIDPVNGGKPIFVSGQPNGDPNSVNGRPLFIDPLKPPPALTPGDAKGFSKHPSSKPFGPMDVLINAGFPDKPQRFPFPPPIHSGQVPISPGAPLPNEGRPFNDKPGILDLGPSEFPTNGHGPINIGFPILPRPTQTDSLVPPFGNANGNARPPPFLPAMSGFNPFLPAPNPNVFPKPNCGNPNLKPYVPPGFHLSSINQFHGMVPTPMGDSPVPAGPPPCSTLDMLKKLDFKIMRSLIESSGLQPLFEHTRNYTLFVPSDAAFRRLPRWFRESLDDDKKLKKALVLNHLVKDDLPLGLLNNEGLVLSARPGGSRLRVNIYQSDSSYRTITVDGSEVEKGDILTANGRLHIVQKVLMPNLPRNAAQFLSEKLEFEGFWNLVKQAELVNNFQDTTPFTLFIPLNDAVKKLNDSLFLDDKEKLKNFVFYHMVNGTYYSNGLINNEFLLTNYEKEIKVQVTSDGFAKYLSGINGKVKILKADISLTNGVAHVIDQCISDEAPFYVYPQSDEFKNEFGVMRRSFRVTGEEKNIENAFKK
ncbi:unnamed protein product [Orchesella dallaii]|uniref:FAS1 domain-containing protein n=1 Tax=Orchesella dallaii TaxID=48710 RepID=A0ABP1PU65_9HEXA